MSNQNLTPPPFRGGSSSVGPEIIVETTDSTRLFTKVFYWMAGALGLTALTAFLVYSSDAIMSMIIMNRWVMWVLFIAELGLVMGLSAAIHKVSFPTAVLMMAGYSVLNGVTMSVILLAYTATSVAMAFVISAGMFAIMAIVGTVTKRDLSSLGSILFMALIGLIIASVVNMFLQSSLMEWIVSLVGVVLFSALTVYDTQKIRRLLVEQNGCVSDEGLHKIALLGSLELYLDFIHLFLFILRLLGGNRR
ncbi:MAG: Bax inhibitor-1/YccA family protein [Bacteroidales bacterium]|nr:Bax inhibitor-1/YccA family protein [Bacteroidales bacterium]MDY3101753.1 Bax inhibitor-1/YccA family protein [Porphyromonas sp.]